MSYSSLHTLRKTSLSICKIALPAHRQPTLQEKSLLISRPRQSYQCQKRGERLTTAPRNLKSDTPATISISPSIIHYYTIVVYRISSVEKKLAPISRLNRDVLYPGSPADNGKARRLVSSRALSIRRGLRRSLSLSPFISAK